MKLLLYMNPVLTLESVLGANLFFFSFAGQWQTPKTKFAYLLPCWEEGGEGKLCCKFCGANNLQIQASLQNLMPWREEERPGRATRETGWGRGPPKRANPLLLHSFGHRRL